VERVEKLRALAEHNAAALHLAIEFCASHRLGCFRVNSQILPLRTHPEFGYSTDLLGAEIVGAFEACGSLARRANTRISFHPDQFVVLNSPNQAVVANSLAELEYQAEVAEWVGADVINIHAGGGYGDKPAALRRLIEGVGRLSDRARRRLTLENDDRTYTPADLLVVCRELGLPLVYDVHHHRCQGDGLGVEEATELALGTWDREPLFHISSPRDGWHGVNRRSHSEYIDLRDFPRGWDEIRCTVEVEAKAKELAVLKLRRALERRARSRESCCSAAGLRIRR
jgi:UV DNA damage endonuclease